MCIYIYVYANLRFLRPPFFTIIDIIVTLIHVTNVMLISITSNIIIMAIIIIINKIEVRAHGTTATAGDDARGVAEGHRPRDDGDRGTTAIAERIGLGLPPCF